MKYISLSRALGYVVPAPAVHAALGPFVEYTSPAPAFYAAPALVVVYISPAPRRASPHWWHLCVKLELNVGVTELLTDLVPYPHIHITLCSYAPSLSRRTLNSWWWQITVRVFQPVSMWSSALYTTHNTRRGRFLCHGHVVPKDVNAAVATV